MKISEVFSRKARRALRTSRQQPKPSADPYYQGDDARHAGKTEADNPYPAGSQDHDDWIKGWRDLPPE